MVRTFLWALVCDWQGALSTTGSVALTLLSLSYWDHPVPRWLTLSVAFFCFLYAAGRAWTREHDGRVAAEIKLDDGRPRLDIEPTKEPELTDQQGPAIFWIRNVGGRPSRFAKFEPLKSELEHYILQFEEIPLIAVGAREPLNYHFVDAITSYDGRNGISWLKLFLNDRPEGSIGAGYVLRAKYQDVDCATEFTESFIIEYAALEGTITTRPIKSLFIRRD